MGVRLSSQVVLGLSPNSTSPSHVPFNQLLCLVVPEFSYL